MSGVPQQLSIITLGTRDLARLRAFYADWGWVETEGSEPDWCAFDLGGVLLALYSLEELAEEAGAEAADAQRDWGGFTLAMNVPDEGQLEEAFSAALRAGATLVARLQPRDWGGSSGYVADPDGNRWELATGGPDPATP